MSVFHKYLRQTWIISFLQRVINPGSSAATSREINKLGTAYFCWSQALPCIFVWSVQEDNLATPNLYSHPILKSFAIKIFNPKYSQIQDSSGTPFFCQCCENHDEPGVQPTPSDQGCLETCTVHATSKAIVSFLDKKNIDGDQDKVANGLLGLPEDSGHLFLMERSFKF